MQAITTTSKRIKNRSISITARTASGRFVRSQVYENTFSGHQSAAKELSRRMGWGENLVSGETKEGFAFIPFTPPTKPAVGWEQVEKATSQIIKAAGAFPNGEKDPIRLASGIIDLAKHAAA